MILAKSSIIVLSLSEVEGEESMALRFLPLVEMTSMWSE